MEPVRTLIAQDTAIKIRMTKAEKERLHQGAAKAGVSVAAFIRSSSLAAANSLQTEWLVPNQKP